MGGRATADGAFGASAVLASPAESQGGVAAAGGDGGLVAGDVPFIFSFGVADASCCLLSTDATGLSFIGAAGASTTLMGLPAFPGFTIFDSTSSSFFWTEPTLRRRNTKSPTSSMPRMMAARRAPAILKIVPIDTLLPPVVGGGVLGGVSDGSSTLPDELCDPCVIVTVICFSALSTSLPVLRSRIDARTVVGPLWR